MVCSLCGGNSERRLVTAENWWGERLTLIEGVPADVCVQCGQPQFDAATVEALDRMLVSDREPEKVVDVPVFAFTH